MGEGLKGMRLRQVALVATELDRVRREIFYVLGLEDDFADPGVGHFGLHNSVMAIGDTFLEVVAPMTEGTTAGRLLERRQGDGGYMVLVQVDDLDVVDRRVQQLGARKVWETDTPAVRAFHIHPKDVGAAIVSFDEMSPPESWQWAGEGWENRKARNVAEITAVDLQSDDPETLAARWSELFERPVEMEHDYRVISLDQGRIIFRKAVDGRGDGVSGVEFRTTDLDAIALATEQLGLIWHGNQVMLCGTWFRFI